MNKRWNRLLRGRGRQDPAAAGNPTSLAYTRAPMLGFLSRFVDSNERELKRIQPIVDEINELEPEFESLKEEAIRERIAEVRQEIREAAEPDEPEEDELHHPDLERRKEIAKARRKKEQERIQEALDEVIPEVFAAARGAQGSAERGSSERRAHRHPVASSRTSSRSELMSSPPS